MRSASIDQRSQHDMTARVASGKLRRFRRQFGDEGVSHLVVDNDPLGRHADLALVHERAEGRRVDRLVEIGIVQHDQRHLAAEFEQHRLQLFGRELGNDAADPRRAGEVDAAHGWVGDQRLDDLGGIRRRIRQNTDHALRWSIAPQTLLSAIAE
jgi:hypothetical protein